MRKLKRIIFVLLIVFLIIFLGLNVFALIAGKILLSNALSKFLGQEVRVGSLYIIPPYSLSINNLIIDGLLNVEKIKIRPSIAGLFFGKRGLNELVIFRPEVSIVRLSENRFNFSEIIEKIKPSQSQSSLFIKEAVIKQAKLSFKDRLSDTSFDITPLDASAITSLVDFKTRINLSARAVSTTSEKLGEAKIDGWLNFLKKDMQAKFTVTNVNVAYFSVFFPNKFVKKIKSGTLNFNADAVSKSNDLTIDCHIETRNLSFIGEEDLILDAEKKEVTAFANLSGIILDTLIGPGSGGIFDFSIHTKFDHPRLEGLIFKGSIFKEPIKNILRNPQESIEKFKKAGEDFEKIGKELKEQFKDFKDIFKIKKEEAQETTSSEIAPQ